MDSELKRRLVGTVIIVSLVVIFVPMLFEEKDDLTRDSRETSIPEFPQDFDSQVIPLPEAVPEMKAAKESAPEPAEEPAVPPVARRDDALDPLDVPAGKTPGAPEGAAPAPQAGAAGEDEEDVPTPPAKTSPGTDLDARGAARSPAGRPAPAKPAPPATRLATKSGKPVSEAVPAGKAPSPAAPAPKQTVAPKPPKQKTVTTTALPRSPAPAEIKAIPAAPPPPAVKPAPVPATATAAPAAEAAGAAPSATKEQASLSWWMIQAGSFDDEANAKNLKTRLLQAKIPAFSEKITAPNGVVKFRVRVGPEKERAKAEEILKRMESEAGVKGMIVSYP
jgi:DedD protein